MSTETTFNENEIAVCQAYLTRTRDEAVKMLGVGAGSVSRTWQKFILLGGKDLESQKKISLSLKKDSVTIDEALGALDLYRLLKQEGISDPVQVETLVEAASNLVRADPNLDHVHLMATAGKMLDAEQSTGKTYEEQLEDYHELNAKSDELRGEIANRRKLPLQKVERTELSPMKG
ncbi:MAG: hypothetical protein OK457_04260 [Thaumarchaeota archaeon]|nr:hypothetical protein [Nitrososphaerota archaeon]